MGKLSTDILGGGGGDFLHHVHREPADVMQSPVHVFLLIGSRRTTAYGVQERILVTPRTIPAFVENK